jgi:hypothetical protein
VPMGNGELADGGRLAPRLRLIAWG